MRRREFLVGCGSLSVSGLSWANSALGQTSTVPEKFIDAHCHIFNADDLPIIEFIERVVLPQREEFREYSTKYGHAVRFFVRKLADWMKENAPSAEDEIVLLDKIKNGTARARTSAEIRETDVKQLSELIAGLKDLRVADERFSFREDYVSALLPGVVIGFMHREAYPTRFTDTGIGNIDHAFDPDYWESPIVLAGDLYRDGKGPISHYLRWGTVFTHYRFELADELHRIHGVRGKLITPALIDFSNWLDDKADVKLPAQVNVIGKIARRPGPMRLHAFAPFDPLREAIHRKTNAAGESPLNLVKRAVFLEGFIGVKLYPPMGFLPFANARNLYSGDFPKHLRPIFGTKMNVALDATLDDLYSWCARERVPILAHAADSNGADVSYSKRANPDNWAIVAENFPGIQISLAHFGDFDAGFDRPGHRNPKLSGTWEWHMAALSKKNAPSEIYMDLSYLSASLLDKNNNRRSEVVRMLRAVRQEFEELPRRLLFGTDWIMFGNEEKFGNFSRNGRYADRLTDLLREAEFSDDSIRKVMYDNAGNFLGLTLPGNVPGNRNRLTKFYVDNGLDSSWLNDFPTA